MRIVIPFVLAVFCGAVAADEPKEAKAKEDAAKVQLDVLDKAIAAYRVKKDAFPESLKALVDGKFVEAKGILDPWKKEYEYDETGKRNGGKKPDVWAVTPDKKTIGNWPEKK